MIYKLPLEYPASYLNKCLCGPYLYIWCTCTIVFLFAAIIRRLFGYKTSVIITDNFSVYKENYGGAPGAYFGWTSFSLSSVTFII